MSRLFDNGILRDVGLFAGAFAGIYAIKSMQKTPEYAELDGYPLLQASPLARLANELVQLRQPSTECLTTIERFLTLVSSRNIATNGFAANRLVTEITTQVRRIVLAAQRSKDMATVTRAIDFERDEMEQIGGICDNMLRNMLLDGDHA